MKPRPDTSQLHLIPLRGLPEMISNLPSNCIAEASERINKALALSAADHTEILWRATKTTEVSTERKGEPEPEQSELFTVRVIEKGRGGAFAVSDGSTASLSDAIRQAMAHARAAEHVVRARPATSAAPEIEPGHLFDPELSALTTKEARSLLERHAAPDESARLRWSESAFILARTGETLRSSSLTGATAAIRSGKGPGAGLAEAAARTLARLAVPSLAARARSRAVGAEALADLPAGQPRLLLAPHATAALVAELAALLASDACRAGWPLGPERVGSAQLPAWLTLRDDATSPAGLPRPFDHAGSLAAPVEHILRGVFATPAVAGTLAAELGLPETPQLVSEGEARVEHPTLEPGTAGPDELLRAVDEGVWIGGFSTFSTLTPGSTRIKAETATARRITGARPGAALPSLVLTGDLFELLGQVVAVGQEMRTFALDRDLLAGARVPALALAAGPETKLSPR